MLVIRPSYIVESAGTAYLLTAFAFSLIAFVSAVLWTEVPRTFFLQWLADWRVYKELMMMMSFALTMGLLNCIFVYAVRRSVVDFTFSDVINICSLTLVCGLIPYVVISLLRFLQWEQLQKKAMAVVEERQQPQPDSTMELHVNEGNEKFDLRLQQVTMIESMGNYVKIYQIENQVGKVTIKRITMKRMEELLAGQEFLIRIHRLYFANIAHVHRFYKDDGGNLNLVFENPDKEIPVSRNKRRQVNSLLKIQEEAEHEKFAEALREINFTHPDRNYAGRLTDIQRVLSEEVDKFKLISENVSDIVCLHEPREARYVYVSPSCKDVVGYLPTEMEGKSPYDFFHPDMIKALEEDHRRKEAGEIPDGPSGPPPKIVYLFRTKDRGFRWMESHARPIFDKHGHVVLILSTSRDVHEREEAEKEKQLKPTASKITKHPRAALFAGATIETTNG